MGWSVQGKWPVEKADEICYSGFEDIRKLIFSIRNMQVAIDNPYVLPAAWQADTKYHFGDDVSWKGRAYICVYGQSVVGVPPPQIPWRLRARFDVYSDFNRNSGCFVFRHGLIYPAWVELPPQFNKYLRQGQMSPDGHWEPGETIYGKDQEIPVEFKEFDTDEGRYVITGPIGTQFLEKHMGCCTIPVLLPFRLPHCVLGGHYVPGSSYFDIKRQGYQSFVEAFIEEQCWANPNPDVSPWLWEFEDDRLQGDPPAYPDGKGYAPL